MLSRLCTRIASLYRRDMAGPPFDRLTARQRDCLRELAKLKSIKEIAGTLGISESTVNGHLESATRNLGLTSRTEAALAFQAHERGQDPQISPGPLPRVDPQAAPPAQVGTPVATGSLRLPFRAKGATRNDLSPFERLVWIPVVAVVVAIGFGMLAAGLHFTADLVRLLN